MDIIEYDDYKFLVPIAKNDMSLDDYVNKVKDCLKKFCIQNTECGVEYHCDPVSKVSLEQLTYKVNFDSMHLKGINYCDSKYRMIYGSPLLQDGIFIWNTSGAENKFMMDFVRQKWKEFDYIQSTNEK